MDLSPRPVGRPRSCDCGTCPKCKQAEYMRRWYQKKTPAQRRAWIARRDPERVLAVERARSRTKAKQESIQRSIARHPEKQRARVTVHNHIARGTIQKEPCHCGATRVEAHHPDYSQPLLVEWLCRAHHVERHPRSLMQAMAA